MGTYTLKLNGICGIEQAEVEIACDCDYAIDNGNIYQNYTFVNDGVNHPTTYTLSGSHPGGSAWQFPQEIDYVFNGTITIEADVSVTINNANVKMKPCTKIIMESGSGGTTGSYLYLISTSFTGCDKWQGIIIQGNDEVDHTTSNEAYLEAADHSEFSDAYKAIYCEGGGKLHLNLDYFENNENDITIQNYGYLGTPGQPKYHPNNDKFGYEDQFLHNIFIKGKWMHNDIADIPCTLYDYNEPESDNLFKKMIYLQRIQYINMDSIVFTGNDFLNNSNYVTNGIEINSVINVNLDSLIFHGYLNSGIYADSLSNIADFTPVYIPNSNYLIKHYQTDGYFDEAFHFNNCQEINFGHYDYPFDERNQFLGFMNYGIHLKDCNDILIGENIFNSSTWVAPSAAGGIINRCIYAENVSALAIANNLMFGTEYGIECNECYTEITNNIFNGIVDKGIELYGIPTISTNSISQNTFQDCGYGLIISPDINPIGASHTDNTASTVMQIEIGCNLFKQNGYAILGSGNLSDQGTGIYTNGNKFDRNTEWDLCWMDHDASSVNWFQWYESGNPNADPNPNGLNYPSVYLNGMWISSGNSRYAGSGPIKTDADCFSTLRKKPNDYTIKQINNESYIINPSVNTELFVKSNYLVDYYTVCYDALGRKYNLNLIYFENGIYKFDTINLASGIYFITINNIPLKFYKIQ